MLYGILRILFRITFKVFFRNVYKNRPGLIPESGPLIICANHPGAFLDPVVVASLVSDRKVFFLAKGAVFKGGFAKWFLPKLNIVPVYRQQDDPTQMHKNEETFIRCYEHLGKGGVILIFPEGISITERKLRPIKTGTARIALGAMEKYGKELGVKIACIGLNYENPHLFRKDIYISYSEPINVADYLEKYKTEGFAAAEDLTEEIRKRLEEQMIHTSDEETDRLVADIERLYKNDLMKEQGISKDDKEAAFELSRRIVLTVNFFREREPERVEEMTKNIGMYFQKLQELGISDKVIKGGRSGSRWLKNLKEVLFIVFGFPFFIYGLLHNYLCFFIASFLSKKLVNQKEYKGAIGAAAGMLLYLIWYIFLGIFFWKFFHHHAIGNRPGWEWFAYFISWPVTGLFAWYYYINFRYINKRWLMMSMFYRETKLVAELILMRAKLIKDMEQAITDRDKHGTEPWMYGGKKL
ncbi:MAG TPA: 1-acyl-sn-glycerol-3-phosphate acyltransferase, partial [Bacteroidia bacterium]|nr:1-acyl-sn-glycerol-3-phosphate acyltransferase [Bacteroidia bacterium]